MKEPARSGLIVYKDTLGNGFPRDSRYGILPSILTGHWSREPERATAPADTRNGIWETKHRTSRQRPPYIAVASAGPRMLHFRHIPDVPQL